MDEEPFPWHLGVFDSHCHPTDTVASLEKVSSMKTKALTIMATRRQDQHLVEQFANRLGYDDGKKQDRYLLPAFGWHPWFSHQIYDDRDPPGEQPPGKEAHYRKVITPIPEDQKFLDSLPEPSSLSVILQETRDSLRRFPHALLGEIGLDRAFRIPGTELLEEGPEVDPALTPGSRAGRKLSIHRVNMDHQRKILTAQLNLAGEMGRAVSVHGVAAHGVVYQTLSATWRGHERAVPSKRERKKVAKTLDDDYEASESAATPKPYPPRICLHSYSGMAETVRQYLQPSVPASIFFSFSNLVNFSSRSGKAVEAIKAVPDDKILAESDLHAAGEKMDELMEDIVRRICKVKGWSLEHGVAQLASNWKHFVFG